jgi:hypothetical protein
VHVITKNLMTNSINFKNHFKKIKPFLTNYHNNHLIISKQVIKVLMSFINQHKSIPMSKDGNLLHNPNNLGKSLTKERENRNCLPNRVKPCYRNRMT